MSNFNILNSVSYDQYKNIPTADELGVQTKIIFSQEAYVKLLQMIKKTRDSENETGCFFVGRQSQNNPFAIYVDFYTSEFECEDAFVQGGSANPTQTVYRELNEKIKQYEKMKIKPSVFHFHTHPRQLHFECFSDQDLSTYAKMAYDNKNVNAFGMLGFPIPNASDSNGFTILQPVKPEVINGVGTANFLRFPNMYYCAGNQIYKVGSFEKKYEGRKHKQSTGIQIVKNATKSSTSNEVCGVGKNPNTGQEILDESVGYIDVNGCLCFPNENVSINFKKIELEKSNSSNYER